MFKAIKEFFFGKPTVTPQPVAPYKVETPEVAPALAPVVEAKPELKVVQGNAQAKPKKAAAKKPAAKTTAKPKAAAKPAAKTATAKKPRAPKAAK